MATKKSALARQSSKPASQAPRKPRIGMAARGTTTGRPIMVLFDLLGRRWTLRVLWELRADPMTFRSLQTAMEDVSPSVLNQRLAELRDNAIVERVDDGYALTTLGRDLITSLTPVANWSIRWAQHVARKR